MKISSLTAQSNRNQLDDSNIKGNIRSIQIQKVRKTQFAVKVQKLSLR